MQLPARNEESSRDRLLALCARLPDLDRRIDAFEIRNHGLLHRDDGYTALDPLSAQIHHIAAVAFEQLEIIALVLKQGLPMTAFYPLLRSSIEASANGLWLALPGKSPKRIIRALRMTLAREDAADMAVEGIAPKNLARRARVHARLLELKNSNKYLMQSDLDATPPDLTVVLRDAGPAVPKALMKPLHVWQLCSGLTHGNRELMHRVLERRQISDWSGGRATFHMTSSFTVIYVLFQTAFETLIALIERIEHLAEQP